MNSVLSGADEELKDVRPPADLYTRFWEQPAVLILGALAVLAAVAVSVYLLYHRSRRSQAAPEPVPDTRAPWEVAAEELDRIFRLDLPGRGDLKEHYTLVAGVLRAYLGTTFLGDESSMDATEMSTQEINAGIWHTSLDHGNARLVIELLQEADLFKFANYAPSASRAHEAAGQVRNIVEATRPALAGAEPRSAPVRQVTTA